jgi:hypothetical protein
MNYIIEYPNSLSPDFCESIISKFEKSKYQPGSTMGGYNPNVKDTFDYSILHNNTEWQNENEILYQELSKVLNKYVKQVQTIRYPDGTIINMNNLNMLTDDSLFNIQVYKKNIGKYTYHSDFKIDAYNNFVRYRMITFIWYLNNVDEGGETEFWGTYKIKPETGKLVLFPACWTYPHTGIMPISSDKYIITGWLYKDQFAERVLELKINQHHDVSEYKHEEESINFRYF